ncbi:hypothetical protein M8C21_019891 [Ambrosia artemisiifolia]|uniref:Uncharacterized protein n=1 Tax=Ambrosia artemisiifolia TaxID=4212 RepID=A0AAD5BPZ3_AMBAR|nr:hypothetical protein M8C21_019891 [Ambrosia artemisiifolia]
MDEEGEEHGLSHRFKKRSRSASRRFGAETISDYNPAADVNIEGNDRKESEIEKEAIDNLVKDYPRRYMMNKGYHTAEKYSSSLLWKTSVQGWNFCSIEAIIQLRIATIYCCEKRLMRMPKYQQPDPFLIPKRGTGGNQSENTNGTGVL